MSNKYCTFIGSVLSIICSIFLVWWTQVTHGELISPANSATNTSWNQSFFIITNPQRLKFLSDSQKSSMLQRTHGYIDAFTGIVNDMTNQWLLTLEDQQQMLWKVNLQYVNNCTNIDGKISINTYTVNDVLVRNELWAINLYINICFERWFISQLQNNIEQVITHELGHFFYYFHDVTPSVFQKICRIGSTKKALCTRESFVSKYAMTNDEEDYAESFSFWYLDRFPLKNKSKNIEAKKLYFEQLIK